ncbi:MAG: NADP-dependent oxidoreductase [Pseudomonadota bacterium]
MRRVVLKHALNHKPVADDFEIIDIEPPSCPEDGVLLRVVYLSLDPYIGSRLRGRHMGDAPPAPGSGIIPGAIIGQVIDSRSSQFQSGDWVHSMEGGWQEICALNADQCRRIDPRMAPLSTHLGVLGMPGLTAWASVTQLAKVTAGDVVLVDAAAGPVGGTVGQIARIMGASRVVGIAGGPEKCRIVTGTYGFDACINYRTDNWRDDLAAALTDGLTVFHENVSAEMAMQALSLARPYARGVLCGLVDAYHTDDQSQHPLNAGFIIAKRAQIFGLVVYDFYPKWDEFVHMAAGWLRDGKLTWHEDRANGLEAAPAHFEKLLNGQNQGKAIIAVSPEQNS